MKLDAYDAEQLDYLHALVARGRSAPECLRSLSERWPDAHVYTAGTLRAYLKSEEGIERGQAVLKEIRERAIDASFADKGSRIDLLSERAESLARQLRVLENPPLSEEDRVKIEMGIMSAPMVDPRAVSALNAELRQTMAQLQKEKEPLAEMSEAVAPAMAMFQGMMRAGVSPAAARARFEAEDEEVPS